MKKKTKPEFNIDKCITHLEEYENNSIVKNVLSQDSSFEKEVESFYDLSTWWQKVPRGLPVREFKLQEEDSQKRGILPIDLVKILNNFSKKTFETSKLQYNAVREDYQRWNTPSRRITKGIAERAGMLASLGGLLTYIYSAENGNPNIVVPASVASLGLALTIWTTSYFPKPKGTNDELGEYLNLHSAAEKADRFTNKYYRKYFLEKTLSKNHKPF